MTELPTRYGTAASTAESSDAEQLSRMITLVSHELKNPLSAIQLTAEMLFQYREHFSVADQDKYLQNILSNTQMLKELIDKTSIYYRLHFDIVSPIFQDIELNEFLRNVQIEASEWSDCQHPIDFHPNAEAIHLPADAYLLKYVLENVLKNAIHFSNPGTPISMALKQEDNLLEISISDLGVGFLESNLEQLFHPYYRTPDATGHTGTGLGLSICRLILQKHNADIRLTHNSPQGTTVSLRFPNPNFHQIES